MDAIRLCPSPPHRAVLGLVRAAAGGGVAPGLADDLRASDPEALVKIAFDGYVHVVLATGFDLHPELAGAVPADLVIFFREMQAANATRNATIRGQLETIGGILAAGGFRGIALKGAAELLAPVYPDPAFRFLSDVDILVPDTGLGGILDRLHRAGAVSLEESAAEYDAHHHVPPLGAPGWPVPLELHRAVGAAATGGRILPAGTVFAAAGRSDLPGLDLPAPAHRLVHAVVHAQLHPPRYRERVLSLRDVFEMEMLVRHLAPDGVAAAAGRFEAPGDLAAWQALDAARRLIFGSDSEADAGTRPVPDAARGWAEAVIARFGRPGQRRASALLWMVRRMAADMVSDPQARRRLVHQMTSPRRLRKRLAHHWQVLRRQR